MLIMTNIDEMKQEAKDAKDRAKTDKAYDASLTSTVPAPKPKKYAKGGSVTRADGCVTKGHTKGKMV